MMNQAVEYPSGSTRFHSNGVGASHLAQDLGLADNHGIDTARHAEQMPERSVVVIRVQVIAEILGRDMAELGEEVPYALRARMEARHGDVHLDPVARRQHGSLEDVFERRQLVQRLRQTLLGDRKALEELDGSGLVIEPNDDERRRGQRALLRRTQAARRLAGGGDRLGSLLVEGQDLKLDGQVHLANVHIGWKVHYGGSEVENGLDPGVDEALTNLLSRGRRGCDDRYRDAVVDDRVFQLVEMTDE